MISIHEFKRLADSIDYKEFKRILKFSSEFADGEHQLVMKLRPSHEHKEASQVVLLSGWCDYTSVADQFNTLFSLQPEETHNYHIHTEHTELGWDWVVRNNHGALLSKCTESHLTQIQAEEEAKQEVKHLVAELQS
ncbi:hypothetical protein VPHK120G1_0024 [Vibrio phage K120 g1]